MGHGAARHGTICGTTPNPGSRSRTAGASTSAPVPLRSSTYTEKGEFGLLSLTPKT